MTAIVFVTVAVAATDVDVDAGKRVDVKVRVRVGVRVNVRLGVTVRLGVAVAVFGLVAVAEAGIGLGVCVKRRVGETDGPAKLLPPMVVFTLLASRNNPRTTKKMIGTAALRSKKYACRARNIFAYLIRLFLGFRCIFGDSTFNAMAHGAILPIL